MITEAMVSAGYATGVIRIVDSPNGDGAVCQIGDNWFYFGGHEAEGVSAEEYVRNTPLEDIITEIHIVLTDFGWSRDDELADEYRYYESYLREHGITK